MLPIASAGKRKPPMAIVAPLTIILMDSASIVFRISVDREVGLIVAESPWLRMSAAARLFPDESSSSPLRAGAVSCSSSCSGLVVAIVR